jgi:hypothetical protein
MGMTLTRKDRTIFVSITIHKKRQLLKKSPTFAGKINSIYAKESVSNK